MNLFKKPKAPSITIPPAPKPRRMPVYSDPNIQMQGKLAREKARRRKGMLSTILSDTLAGDAGTLG